MARKVRQAARAADEPRKVKRTICLDPESDRRIGAYAGWRNETLGAIVARAVEAEIRSSGFVVYSRTQPGATAEEGPRIVQDESEAPRAIRIA